MSNFIPLSGAAAVGLIEWIFLVLIWAIQIGAVLILAAFLTLIAQMTEEAIRKKKVKFRTRLLIVFVIICVILAAFALRPPVVCAEEYETRLTPEWRETVRSVSSGVYSWNVPLVPVCVRVTGIENFIIDGAMEYRVEFDVYYFCCGRMGMEYSTYDGFNIAEPLFLS